MCIIIQSCWRTKKDFEVFVIRWIENKKILSPFVRAFKWKIKKLYEIPDNGPVKMSEESESSWFHSLLTLEDAEYYIRSMTGGKDVEGYYKIYKALIPQNSKIIKGKIESGAVGGGSVAIGSKKLMLTQQLSHWRIQWVYNSNRTTASNIFYHDDCSTASTGTPSYQYKEAIKLKDLI